MEIFYPGLNQSQNNYAGAITSLMKIVDQMSALSVERNRLGNATKEAVKTVSNAVAEILSEKTAEMAVFVAKSVQDERQPDKCCG